MKFCDMPTELFYGLQHSVMNYEHKPDSAELVPMQPW